MSCQYKIDEMSLCSFEGECENKGKFSRVVQYGKSIDKKGIPVYGSCYESENIISDELIRGC